MKELINSKVTGNTEAGRAWCLKALHPSEDIPGNCGIPDRCAAHTVNVNYVQRVILPAQDAAAPWSAGITLMAHPLAPCSFNAYDHLGTGVYATLYNTQVPGYDTSAFSHLNNWIAMAQQWRVTHGSITVELDASALYNQGSVVAAVKPVEARRLTQIFTKYDGVALTPVANCQMSGAFPVFGYQTGDMPSSSTLAAIPGAYQGTAKDGIYMPLPIDFTDQQWQGEKDLKYFGSTGMPGYTQNWPAKDEVSNDGVPATPVGMPPLNASISVGAWYTTHGGCGWPLAENITGTFSGFDAVKPVNRVDGALDYCRAGDLYMEATQPSTCQMFFSNLSPNAQLICTVRIGFEIIVQPSTVLSTQAVPSPLYDPLALDAYYAIRRSLAMAYPAAYNDLNKLLKVILTGARAVLPALSAVFPGLAPFVVPGEALLSGADALRSAISRRNGNDKSSKAMQVAAGLAKKKQ